LQVHHKKYNSGEPRWKLNLEDLEALCKECHVLAHRQPIPIYYGDGSVSHEFLLPIDDDPNPELDTGDSCASFSIIAFSLSENINKSELKPNAIKTAQKIMDIFFSKT